MTTILIFGGSFDPIHNAHISTAVAIQEYFSFDSFIFLPCKIPVHKEELQASAKQRLEMLKLALAEQSPQYHFSIDTCEIDRKSPSYTLLTLKDYRRDYGNTLSLTLLMGLDSFLALPQWYEWKSLLSLANIIILHRPPFSLAHCETPLKEILKNHQVLHKKDLLTQASGCIYYFNAIDEELSSTKIRSRLEKGEDVSEDIPPTVLQFIKNNHLYGKT